MSMPEFKMSPGRKLQLGPASAEQLLKSSAEMLVDLLKPGNKQGTHILRQIPDQLKQLLPGFLHVSYLLLHKEVPFGNLLIFLDGGHIDGAQAFNFTFSAHSAAFEPCPAPLSGQRFPPPVSGSIHILPTGADNFIIFLLEIGFPFLQTGQLPAGKLSLRLLFPFLRPQTGGLFSSSSRS